MRSRTESFNINSYQKFDYIKNSNVKKDTSPSESIESLKNTINEEKFNNNIIEVPELSHNINIEVPKYFEIKKNFKSKNPIKFHEKAKLTNFDMKNVEEIKSSEKKVQFKNFCCMFHKSDEVEEVSVENLLNIDLNDLKKIKEKLQKIIAFVSSSSENENVKNSVIQQLNLKLEEIKNIEENMEKISVNVKLIKEISYNDNNTTIYFNK